MDSHPALVLDRLGRDADQLALGCAPVSPVAAMEQAEGLYAVIDRLEAAAASRVQVVDAAGEAKADGYTSTTAWLRQACRMWGPRASERGCVARQLRRLPVAAMRFVRGQVGFHTAAVVCRAVKNLTDADTAKAEPILLDADADAGPDGAAIAGRKIHEVLHPDGKLSKKDEQFQRRWFAIGDLMDGAGRPDGFFDPESCCGRRWTP